VLSQTHDQDKGSEIRQVNCIKGAKPEIIIISKFKDFKAFIAKASHYFVKI
jgi:hypothetical protein